MNIETNAAPEAEQPIVTTSAPDPAPEVQETEVDEPNATDHEDESADGEEASERAPLPKGVERSLKRMARKAGEAERTAREYAVQLELANERLKQYEQPAKPEATATPASGEPTLEEYDFDQQAHARAMAKYVFQQETEALRKQDQESKVQKTQQERFTSFQEREAAFSAEVPDYDEVARNPAVPISQSMVEAMMESPETAPQIAYYLGQHIDEAAAIAQMTPIGQALAIGGIKAKFTASTPTVQPRRAPNAPPPVKTLNSSAPVSKAPEDMTMEEYAAKRIKERQARGLT